VARSLARPGLTANMMAVAHFQLTRASPQTVAVGVRAFSSVAAEAGQPTSFVSRLKKKMEKSFEDSKKTIMQQATEENEKRLTQLLLNTPKGQFNMHTIKGFYTELKQEAEAKGDNIIASRDEQFQQGLDQIKRFLRILDGFANYELEFPMLIDNKSIQRVAMRTMSDFLEVETVVIGCKSTMEMHSWVQKRKENNLPVPENPQLIQNMMQKEMPKRSRLQGGFLARLYREQDAPRKKRLPKYSK